MTIHRSPRVSTRTTAAAIAAAVLFSHAAAWALPARWTADLSRARSQVEFHATGKPGFLKIHGQGARAGGSLAGSGGRAEGTVSVELAEFSTGISLRDRHMKEKYLETGKFPKAVLTFKDVEIPGSLEMGGDSVEIPFQGDLTLHGVTRAVQGKAKLRHPKELLLGLEAEFGLDIGEFKIASPGFSGVTMAKDVVVHVTLEAPLADSTKGQ